MNVESVIEHLPEWRPGGLDLKGFLRETVAEIGDNDLPGVAAEMAFHSALAILPFLLFIAGLTAFSESTLGLGNLTERLSDRAREVWSDDAASVVESYMEELRQSQGIRAVLLGLIGMLWAGSNAIGAGMKGLNRIEDCREDRNMVKRKLLSVALAGIFGGLIVLAAVIIAAAPAVGSAAGGLFGVGSDAGEELGWLAWPLGFIAIIAAVASFYWIGPSCEQKIRWVSAGAVVFAAGWLLASAIFNVYVTNFDSYNRIYGALGLVIVVLGWLYWSNLLVLIGGQVNRILDRAHEKGDGAQEIRERPRGSQAQP